MNIEILDRPAWLAERKTGIGATEGAAVVNLHPWQTPLGLYLEKTGLVPPREPTARMLWGLKLESLIAEEYALTHPDLQKAPSILRHPQAPWCLASLDYLLPDRCVEIKTVGAYSEDGFGEPGTDEIPKHYFLQVQQQMACAQLEKADLVALFLGSYETHVYTIVRRDDVIAELVEAEREFMDRVARRDPPLPDFDHPTTAQLLAMIEPDSGTETVLDDATQGLVTLYQIAGEKMRTLAEGREKTKSQIIHAMGKYERGIMSDGRIVRRKEVTRKEHVVKESSYIDFRILKGKS